MMRGDWIPFGNGMTFVLSLAPMGHLSDLLQSLQNNQIYTMLFRMKRQSRT